MLRLLTIVAMVTAATSAESIKVWSEFQRIDPFGNVMPADRARKPREIISPAVMRNGFASFHLAVTVEPDKPAFLYVQQNPETLQVTVYREMFAKTASGWTPHELRRVKLPYTIVLPDTEQKIP